MIASMSQAQNLPQLRQIVGTSSSGGTKSSLPSSVHSSSIACFANNSLGGAESQLGTSPPSRWQVPCPSSDFHVSTRWPNNSSESSGLGCCTDSDDLPASSCELFRDSVGSKDWRQHFADATDRYASLASMFPGGVSGVRRSRSDNRTASGSSLQSIGVGVGSLISNSPRLPTCQSWNSSNSMLDQGNGNGNLSLPIDPSDRVFTLQQDQQRQQRVSHPTSQTFARFPSNPGFAERAARFSAFGNGQYSPSFPLKENGNLGHSHSPSFENYDNNKRAKASLPVSGVSGVANRSSTTDLPSSGRLLAGGLHSDRSAAGKGASIPATEKERVGEDRNGKGEAKASCSSVFPPTSVSSPSAPEQEANPALKVDEIKRATSKCGASDTTRGMETDHHHDQRVVELGRISTGKKRKNPSLDDTLKDPSSPVPKEQKSSVGQLKRSSDSEEAVDREEQKTKAEWSGSENSGVSSSLAGKETSKAAEQPKLDYIHVRARRGQATDSHSLAERVRREKISERMKFLQDLVPGCSKVTGKAVMLDEIINYVQSIQQQVEFLSMKLAAVTPGQEFNTDNFLSKQLQIGNGCGPANMVERPDTNISFHHLHPQQSLHFQHADTRGLELQPAVDATQRRMNGNPMPLPKAPMEVFMDGLSQGSSLWDGDLQSVVQMGFGQTVQNLDLSGLQCDLPPGHMKMEL